MKKKKKNSPLDDYEKLKNEIVRDRANDIFRNHPKDWAAKLEDFGFTWFDDEDDTEEIEEQSARPENKNQEDLVNYFENGILLSEEIFISYSEEKAAENPNLPLIRKYFRAANPNLKALLLYGLDNHSARIDLLDDLAFFHEFKNILTLLITYYTRACVEQTNLETFTELARDFYFATFPDGYEAYHALRELFKHGTSKRIIIDALIQSEEKSEEPDWSIH
jgi:hypothetical protein